MHSLKLENYSLNTESHEGFTGIETFIKAAEVHFKHQQYKQMTPKYQSKSNNDTFKIM